MKKIVGPGRPKMAKKRKRQFSLQISVNEKEYREIQKIAKKKGVSVSEIGRTLIFGNVHKMYS